MAQKTRTELYTFILQKILSGGKRTDAENLRDVLDAIVEAAVNAQDDDDTNLGYLKVDSSGKVDISKIKQDTPAGKFSRDNGTWDNPALISVLTGYVSGAGTISASDTILTAIQKLNGNYNPITAPITGFTSGAGTLSATDTILQAIQKLDGNNKFKPLFESFADAGNVAGGETDLISNSIASSQLAANGDKLQFQYGGNYFGSASAKRLRVYFGGVVMFDSGALSITTSSSYTLRGMIIRVSSTVIRFSISLSAEAAGPASTAYDDAGEVTGLTLSNANVLKLTGQASGGAAATNDVVNNCSMVNYIKAA